MAKKKKSRLKKILKAAVPMLAVAGLGKAFMDARNRRASIENNEAKEFGFGQMKMKDFGPYSSKVMNAANNNRKRSILADPKINKMDTSEVDIPENYFEMPVKKVRPDITFGTGNDGLDYGLKSGGRVVKTGEKVAKRKKKIGIQIKGFGKARRG